MACLALSGILEIALYQAVHRPVFLADASCPSPMATAHAAPPALDGRIDPNTAQWHDLTPLPRIGEALARRIVAYREAKIQEWQATHPRDSLEHAPPVFATPEDLLQVKGIGPKTLDLLRRHLRWPGEDRQEPVQP